MIPIFPKKKEKLNTASFLKIDPHKWTLLTVTLTFVRVLAVDSLWAVFIMSGIWLKVNISQYEPSKTESSNFSVQLSIFFDDNKQFGKSHSVILREHDIGFCGLLSCLITGQRTIPTDCVTGRCLVKLTTCCLCYNSACLGFSCMTVKQYIGAKNFSWPFSATNHPGIHNSLSSTPLPPNISLCLLIYKLWLLLPWELVPTFSQWFGDKYLIKYAAGRKPAYATDPQE